MIVYYPQQYGYYPTQYQAQWVELIVPVVVGMMFIVVMLGMVRDLFRGKEVTLPF